MMRKHKLTGKILAASLAVSMVAASSLTGCSKTSADGIESGAAGSSAAGSQAAESAAEGGKLTIALQTNAFITDYDENYFTKLLEKELGVELEFYLLPADTTELRTKVSLMVSSKDSMPDIIICDNCLTPEMILDYGSKGAFIPLNDYLKDSAKSPNLSAVPAEDKEVMMKAMTCADGNVYSLPKYEPETWNLTPNRMFINGEWLKKLNLKVPTTTDELYTVLTAFRDGDPNGNGIQDEIGVYGFAAGGYGQNTAMGLINSFVFYNGGDQNSGLALDENNKVIAPFATDGWKQGLEYMNKLYTEGLLAASMFTDDETQFKATLNNESANVVGFVSAGSTGNWPDVDKNKNFQELDLISPLAGPSGIAYTPYKEYSPGQNFFITSACQNPDLAFKLGDLFFKEDISKVARFGEEGVDWTQDPAECANYSNSFVDAGLYDKINLVYKTNIWAENASKMWHNVQPRYAPLTMGNTVGNGLTTYNPDLKSAKLGAYSYEHYYSSHPEQVLPLLHYTSEEADQTTEAVTNISEYVKQSLAEFVTGAKSTSTDWDSYIKEMDNMGLQKWLECAQAAYDRTK